MEPYLKDWIQRDAAVLDAAASVSAEEYVKQSGIPCATGHDHARQLGGVQALAGYLLLTLEQAGLYVPEGEVQE